MMISYSNNLEDVILNRVFADISTGFYIDVGSYKPLDHSNTMALYQRGWRGVACDPIYNFEQGWANEWHALRPRDLIVRDMICDRAEGQAEFFMCNFRGMSTGAKKILNQHHEVNGAHVSEQGAMVNCTTLNRVIEHAQPEQLHLVCIDVEGMEEQVLRGLDFHRHRPWLFCIEAVYSSDCSAAYESWEYILLAQDYEVVYDDRINRYYLAREHSQLTSRFLYPPNVLDNWKSFREWELERRLAEYESWRPRVA
jgi:FkbM family methyltransferase